MIFAVLDVSWTMGLNSDKTSEVFCINIYNDSPEIQDWKMTDIAGFENDVVEIIWLKFYSPIIPENAASTLGIMELQNCSEMRFLIRWTILVSLAMFLPSSGAVTRTSIASVAYIEQSRDRQRLYLKYALFGYI